MVWLAAHMPFAAAAEAFRRIARRPVPTDAIWDATQQHGERLKRHVEQQQAQVGVERVVLPPAGADHGRPLGVSLDGGKINIRSEGWKEFKAGAVFDLVAVPALNRDTGEWVDAVHGVNITYRAVLDKRYVVHIPGWYRLQRKALTRLNDAGWFGDAPSPERILGQDVVRWLEHRFAQPNRELAGLTGLPLTEFGWVLEAPEAPFPVAPSRFRRFYGQ